MSISSMAFLRAIFPETMQGAVRFVTGTPGNFPGDTYFLTIADIHRLDELPFNTENLEVFFTPHTLSRQALDITKEDTLQTGCCWLECDDEHFNPASILPNAPSMVVESSPGRTHAYWLLNQHPPADPRDVEIINRTLAYKYLTKDRSGWALTKLLRVPGYTNSKYDPPASVKLLTTELDRRYAIQDFALDVAAAPAIMDSPSDNLGPPPTPSPDERDHLLQQLTSAGDGAAMPLAIQQLLTVRQRDRSRALWAVSNWCSRNNLSQEQAFQLLYESPNNKFQENRFNGREGLWRDIHHAFRNAISVDRPQAIAKIRQLRQQRGLPPDVRFEETAKLVYKTMAQEGQFYFAPRTAEALYYTQSPFQIVPLGPSNQECATYLGVAYSLNGSTQEFKYVAEHLRALAEAEAPRIRVRDLAYFDRKSHLLYVTDFKGSIYRLDGDKIEHVHNGVDDGVFFRPGADSQGYTPDFTAPEEYANSLFGMVNLPSDKYPVEDIQFLIRAWFFSLFFTDLFETRPILILEGPKGSGKTVALKVMEWILRGENGAVYSLPPHPIAFRQAIRGRNFMFFDGVDEPFKGFTELLSTTATGTIDRQRILYTDNRMAEYEMRAFIGITTMNAHYMRHDVADRSILLKTARRTSFTSESDIKQHILTNRGRLWGSLLKALNAVVQHMKHYKAPTSTLRMADFASFLYTLCDLDGRDTRYFTSILKAEQNEITLRRSAIWDTLRVWMSNPANISRAIAAQDLHNELLMIGHRNKTEYARTYPTFKVMGAALMPLQATLGFTKRPSPDGSKVLFTFSHLDDTAMSGPSGF